MADTLLADLLRAETPSPRPPAWWARGRLWGEATLKEHGIGLLGVTGILLSIIGAWMVTPPLGVIVLGAWLLTLALALS